MKQAYILLDVGGTEIKGAVSDEKGQLLTEIRSFCSYAQADKETIIENFVFLLREFMSAVQDIPISGVGFAFPGPFDYEHGISFMKGIHKYDSLYGLSLTTELKRRLPLLEPVPFLFLHDIEAFALGACSFGAISKERKVFCLCIGTGIGSAFLEDKRLLKTEENGIPKDGWIYDIPYKESILDDYISARGLATLSSRLLGEPKTGKELAELCRSGSMPARQVWETFGTELKDSVTPFLDSFRPDAVVIGGQISKSFSLFGHAFHQECVERQIKLYLEPETSKKALQGLWISITRREKDVTL